jgi:hypothetical protein
VARTTSIPDRPEAVTPEWLTGALASVAPGAEVARVDVLRSDSGTTGRLRLRLDYAPGPSGPEAVFVKLAPFDEAQRRLVAATEMGRREARFYEGPAREAPLPLPRPYFAAHGDEPTQYVMVLEDLEAAGGRFMRRSDPHGSEHAEQVVTSLAALHAHFWEDPRFDDDLAWVTPAMRGGYAAKLIARALDRFGDDLPPVFSELCRLYVDNDDRIVELWDDGERTLIHGDTHVGNQFVRDGRVGFYDWAVISRSPGIRDVATYLGNSCPTEVRQKDEEHLVRTYRRALADAGVDAPPFEVLWDRYRRTVLYAWVAATTTATMGSKWQPIEVGMQGMAQSTQACADLETVEAIREAL